ncbi:MAG TPA: sulfite exporter TauE/SafE family protein [Vineibacter sp.]|nr:sulfite exporter TauE/SafE family protein [Vineibacter sp.]
MEQAFAEIWRPGLAIVAVAALVAGFVRGMAGFGGALILTPVFSAVFSPALAVPTLGIADFLISSPLTLQAVRRCRWREVLPLAGAAMATLPLGAWLLLTTEPTALRIALSLAVLLAVALLAAGWRYQRTPSLPTTLAVGGVAGVMGGAIGISGPPVVMFWLAGQADAAQARANTFAFFGVTAIGTQLMYALSGLLTPTVLTAAALLIPVYGAGLYAGAHAFTLVSERTFRRVAFSLIAAVALATLIAALWPTMLAAPAR